MIFFNYKDITEIVDKEIKNSKISIETKNDGSYVTNVDKNISHNVYNYLKSKNNEKFNYISEEEIFFERNDLLTFVIDPLDGTENFVSGLPYFGFSLSCYKNNEHKQSMIYIPSENKIYDTSFKIIKKQNIESRLVGLSSSLKLEDLKNYHGNEYRIFGSAVYNISKVIKGNLRAYINPSVNSWDILGGINICKTNDINVKINGVKYNGEFLSNSIKYSVEIYR